MNIGISALTTNADKLDKCIDKNEKGEQDEKDKQLYDTIERKVKKEQHKREKPKGQDGALKKCKSLFNEGASPEVLTKLEKSLIGQEKYYRYYVQCFLTELLGTIVRSKKLDDGVKQEVARVISEISIRYSDKGHSSNITQDRRGSTDSEPESGYGSDVEGDHKVEISDGITHNNVQLLKAIKNGNNRKFKKYLKDCPDISSIKAEKGNNILHRIALLEKKQKRKFLGTLIKTVTKEDLTQLVDGKNQDGKTPLQVALVNKITRGKHGSHTIQSNDNTLKFLVKLLEHGASSDNLGLSREELQGLKEEHKTYYYNFLEKLEKQGKNSQLKPEIRTNIKAKTTEIISHIINTPDSNANYQLHLAIQNNDQKLFEELLQKRADISLKDEKGNNAIHHIASLKKENKIIYLKIILAFEKEGVISSKKLHETINAKNNDERYPTQVALIRQAENVQSKLKDFSRCIRPRPIKHYYTTEFCVVLLQNGAENKSDHITIPKEHYSIKYYHTVKRVKDRAGVSLGSETQKELEELFSKKNGHKNIDLPVKWILGGLIFATVFSALAGNMVVAAILSVTIAVCAMCYPVYLKLENVLNAKNPVAQEPSDQPEHTESPPDSRMSTISVIDYIASKLSSLAL